MQIPFEVGWWLRVREVGGVEPVTMLVVAVAVGAATGLTGTAERAVTDAYDAVKSLITGRYRSVDVEVLERQPQSAPGGRCWPRNSSRPAPGTMGIAGCGGRGAGGGASPRAAGRRDGRWRLREVRAGELEIIDVTASAGAGMIAENVSVDGSFTISGIRAGTEQPPHPPAAQQ